ncbi:YggS family pyridoxal phosphate-dependent enzyme [Roseisolibacter sp. H3M3-2]|uniref:YggS family pyridoxal phosphate-dependent enzyme n=1 Tax=Roseisolibacter sp. H3M3-2 TaxID=3031323 RepID=UPI0023DC3F08|nr:YggS family pyridoxal phosphate-dependent enzyme [Roseisolibacter sp. H3M3-2]MDF1504398.1 YggS family pyridoxal phosphate-dependent enzyme [Roseisolibacter sp. H3M3-2]
MPYPELAERLAAVRAAIDGALARGGHQQRVTVVAVTKTHGPEAVRAAWEAGLHDVGENRVQEAAAKMAALDVPVRWHLIGHLQRNKVRQLDGFALVQSMDSPRLADALHAEGVRRGRPIDVLLQVNASGEASKGGYAPDEVVPEAERLTTLPGVVVRGVMTMAPFDAGERVLRATFAGARAARAALAEVGHPAAELSMGMSGDYEVAVEEGATMVRLGTLLFGARG